MATKFGRIGHSEISFEEQTFHKNQTITSASLGVHHHFGLYNDKKNKQDDLIGLLTQSGSHWAFVHTMFYSSGSSKINTDEREKFNSIFHNYNQVNDLTPHHNNKFHDTASIFYIPQQYFGERIKPGTFQLTARSGSSTNTTKQIIIKDDKYGNLYSSNAYASRSNATPLSSSANYAGNLFYDLGIAVLTETGSWSGSKGQPTDVSYMDINFSGSHGTREYKFWDMKFNTTTPIYSTQYSIKINSGEFNKTMNYSTVPHFSGSVLPSGSNVTYYTNLKNELTTGSFSPYFNQIQLYRTHHEEPVLIANLPRSIQKRDDVDLIITFRVDH